MEGFSLLLLHWWCELKMSEWPSLRNVVCPWVKKGAWVNGFLPLMYWWNIEITGRPEASF